MQPIRVKTVQESDLRMLGNLARNIQRVLPVTQADIDAAAALGNNWVVWKVFEVAEPLDNMRGGTQLIIRQNSIQAGQNVRRVIFVSAPGGQTVIIRGSEYIVLPDAIADSLEYLKAFGGTEQRNIPQPYTQVNYVTNTAQTAVDTGRMIDFAKNYEFEVECRAVSGSWYILQSRASASGNVTGIHGETSGSTIKLVVGNVTVCTSAITRTVGNKLYVKATLNAGTATLYVKDETANTEDTQTGSYGTSQPNPTASVYLLGNAGGQYVDVNSDIYMARIKENGAVVMDYVPARQVATAGFYDKASGTFKTALTPANLSADGNTVPTPDAPMDIVSNNGAIKYGQHGKNLFDINNAVRITRATSTEIPLGETPTITIENNGFVLGTPYHLYFTDYMIPFAGQTNTQYTLSVKQMASVDEVGIAFIYSDGTVSRTRYQDTTLTYRTYTSNANKTVVGFALDYGNGSQTLTLQDIQIELGTAATSFEPYYFGLYTDGTVETINVHGKNLFDKNTMDTGHGWYLNSSNVVAEGSALRTVVIDCKPNTKYSFWHTAGAGQAGAFVMDTNTIQTGDAGTLMTQSPSSMVNANFVVTTYTTPANAKKLYIVAGNTSNGRSIDDQLADLMVVEGTVATATEYEPYFDGGTATAEMLLKVDNYTDVQDVLSGTITRNVGVKALDGTENWIYNSSQYPTFSLQLSGANGSLTGIPCTHFSGHSGTWASMPDGSVMLHGTNLGFRYDNITSSDDWKQWLADLYAAGTPVIVLYPLATATTESVAGQTIQVQQGDNVLEITQASLDNLELEAKYQAAVSLTIQEVQDANLDPNVEVTIN